MRTDLTSTEPVAATVPQGSAHRILPFAFKRCLLGLPFAYLWFRLIDNLHVEWNTNPQYSYGWLVPLLCLGLIMRRWQTPATTTAPGPLRLDREADEVSCRSARFYYAAFFILAFLYFPTRLVEAATPEWRPVQWLLGVEAIGLTLCAIGISKGRGWLWQLAFPIAFFFVAIPWPSIIEIPIIQTLTRVSAVIVIEVLGWIGIPAMPHGNVIEISTGVVGIDEACSGIRSFQSSLMISLFLGEFYRLHWSRRLLLIPLGFLLSMSFNIGRMTLLTVVAANKGVAAIGEYHDPAGVTITIFCTLGLWLVAAWISKRQTKLQTPNSKLQTPHPATPALPLRNPRFSRFAMGLIVWIAVVELGVYFWYAKRESQLVAGPAWSLNFPTNNPTLKDLPIDDDTKYLLRYDDGKQAAWKESDGSQWQGFYFNWLPGRVAGYLAKRHTPEICLVATGRKMVSGPELTMVDVHGLKLPVRSYVFESGGEVLHVFHCRWEAGADASAYVQHESGRLNLVRAIWAGRGNKGQKVLEFVVQGLDDPAQINQALISQLEKAIKVEP